MDRGDTVYVRKDYPNKNMQGCRVKILKFNKSRGSALSTFTVEVLEKRMGNEQGSQTTFTVNDLRKHL